MGTEGSQTYRDDHFITGACVKSLYRTPESNIILHINHSSIKKKKKDGFPGKIFLKTQNLNSKLIPLNKSS